MNCRDRHRQDIETDMPEAIWQKNLRDAILLDPLLLVHGNVKDVFRVAAGDESRLPPWLRDQPYCSFDVWMALQLERAGFAVVLLYDPVDGAVALRGEMIDQYTQMARERPRRQGERNAPAASQPPPQSPTTLPQLPRSDGPQGDSESKWLVRLEVKQSPIDFFRTLYENVLPRHDTPVAVLCRFTDRYLSFTDRQHEQDKELSLLIQKAAMTIPPQTSGSKLNSRLVLVFNTEGEVPQELNVQSPFSHSLLVPSPTLEEREQFVLDNFSRFDRSEPSDQFEPQKDSEHLRLVANLSDGLKTQDLLSLIALSNRERLGLGPRQIKELLDRFRFGTRENAWVKIKQETLRDAKEILRRRVKGQDDVIDEVVPVLIRAKLEMSDVGAGRHSSKPRGVFFFVGPTGVGKTELSKAIAELIFGDETALIRFDMSEYSEEHQQARLIGAPPGYVGFDQGGQLTNAIIEKPFSVVLFDEIEKAHGRILDKFLQILDAGRLTDGMGRTVYFSEAILIFTSNLGTSPASAGARRGGASEALDIPGAPTSVDDIYSRLSELSYPQLCDHFRAAVKDFFVNRLGRPEILNRVGEDNILVFNFLKDADAKTKIIDQQIDVLNRFLQERQRVEVFCTRAFKRLLMIHPNGFERNGARGVRNLLNRFVLNPLAEGLFLDPDTCQGKTFKVDYQVAQGQIDTDPFDKTALHYEWIVK